MEIRHGRVLGWGPDSNRSEVPVPKRAFLVCLITALAGPSQAASAGWFPNTLWFNCDDVNPSYLCPPPTIGPEFSVFVWQDPGNVGGWIRGAQFGLIADRMEILDLVPRSGFVNEGTVTSPSLVDPTCSFPLAAVMIAEIRVRALDPAGGNLCIGPSDQLGIHCSPDCDTGSYYNLDWFGGYFFGDGVSCTTPSSGACGNLVATTPATWGRIKATYR